MSKNRTITAVVNIPEANRKDDIAELLKANGFSLNDLQRFEKQQAYRKEYSQRVEVVAKRKEYSKRRYERMKQLRRLLDQALPE